MSLGKFIKHKREQIGLSQNELADKIGFSRSSINNFELDHQKITYSTAIRLSSALSFPIQELENLARSLDQEKNKHLRKKETKIKTPRK